MRFKKQHAETVKSDSFLNYIHTPLSAYTYQTALSQILWKGKAKHTLQSHRTVVSVIKK